MRAQSASPAIARILLLLLAAIAVLFWLIAEKSKGQLDSLSKNALWLYPYVPRLDRDFDFTVDYYCHRYSGTYSEDFELLFTGASEKPELYLCRDIARRLDRERSVYVDVGANKGLHSIFLSDHFSKVIAFEPYPPIVRSLERNIAQNGIRNILVRPVGLGSREATIPFYVGNNVFTGSFREDFNEDKRQADKLEIRIGDQELEQLGVPRIDLLKVDVEGYEKEVLLGFRNQLRLSRPVVLFELLPSTIRDQKYGFVSEEALEELFPENYAFLDFVTYDVYAGSYRLAPLDYARRKKLNPPNLWIYPRNLVAVPREKLGLIPAENMAGGR